MLLAGEAGIGKTSLARSVLGAGEFQLLEGAALPAEPLPRARWPRRSPPTSGPNRRRTDPNPATGSAPPWIGPRRTARRRCSSTTCSGPTTPRSSCCRWLGRWAATRPVVLVGAFRSDELPRASAVGGCAASCATPGLLREVALEPFDAEATAAARGHPRAGDAAPRHAVLERTDGVPFFVSELAAALARPGGSIPPGPPGGPAGRRRPAAARERPRRGAARVPPASRSPRGRARSRPPSPAGFDPELVAAVAGLPEWPDELARRGARGREPSPGGCAFRHALVREAFYGEIAVEAARGAAPRDRRDGWKRQAPPVGGRRALGRAAATGPRAAGPARRRGASPRCMPTATARGRSAGRSSCGPRAPTSDGRLDALERLGRLRGAGRRPERAPCVGVARGRRERRAAARTNRCRSATRCAASPARSSCRAAGRTRWRRASRPRSRSRRRACRRMRPPSGSPPPTHLRSAASFRAALALLETAKSEAAAAGRPRPRGAHAGPRGQRAGADGRGRACARARARRARARPGPQPHRRRGRDLPAPGRLAGARRRLRGSAGTYDEAFGFCAANALEPTAQLCLACLSVVLRQTGDWDQSAALCRQVLDSPASTLHARGAASGTLGLILALRGQRRAARPLLLESATVARRIELAAMELLSAWGLAVLERARRRHAAAVGRCRTMLDRWRATEERHYVISPLRWSVDLPCRGARGRRPRARARRAGADRGATGQVEAMSALAHALGELALLEGDAGRGRRAVRAGVAQLLADRRAVRARRDAAPRGRGAGRCRPAATEAVEQLVGRAPRRPQRAALAAAPRELAALGEPIDRRSGARPRPVATRRADPPRGRGRPAGGGRPDRTARSPASCSSARAPSRRMCSILGKLDCRSRADAARRATELGLLAARPAARVAWICD